MAPVFIHFTESASAPGGKHAALAISLIAGIIVGMLAQRTRLCMVGGIRDIILFGQSRLLLGFIAILVSAFICNLILTNITDVSYFNLGFDKQPIAHTDGIWNFLGMLLAGFGCVLLGGCPLRQLVLAGEGNSDSAITVLGLIIGAAFAHNFGLASSGNGPTVNGQIAVVIGLIVTIFIAYFNTFSIKSK
ncbi:YedE family putative selenium transporter [Megamonas funiformis]|uniref:YedE family putative selenium transporter n=1 Tax=Megamonas funiformis TaxID=437897 RepID=UPI003AF6EE7B